MRLMLELPSIEKLSNDNQTVVRVFGVAGIGKFAQVKYGALAQLGERLPCTQNVVGSSPTSSTWFFG